MLVSVGLSNRHIHLTQEHVEDLFGKGYELTKLKDLVQPGQYACHEKVDLVGPKGTIKGVRVLGPARRKTQVEISLADGYVLGVKSPIRDSGDLAGSPGIKIVGPKGEVNIEEGVIVAARHIHMHTSDGERLGLRDKDLVKVRVGGQRGLVFENVVIRMSLKYSLEFHVD
ncbi:MAG: phosphate propanoyltransferase, partial [Clostridia bacterium]|nr:phosphate propanoyltransferase [Clostridia bacterium]